MVFQQYLFHSTVKSDLSKHKFKFNVAGKLTENSIVLNCYKMCSEFFNFLFLEKRVDQNLYFGQH